MRNAETVLSIIRHRGRRGLPLERVYRLLFNPSLYLMAYGRIYRNAGATTPGVTPENADGMSLAKIERIIERLRHERFRWHPARRIYIEKKNSTRKRPLGMPTWTDKLVQEVIRLILDAYYDPQFSDHSHGFRPERGCHTALSQIRAGWSGTAWFIEGDISQCFDKLDHQVLLSTLAESIHDNRFLRLIGGALKAGFLEGWKLNVTLSGTPQGNIVSPILANIYLDRLDKFVETTLLPAYTRGVKRKRSEQYYRYSYHRDCLRRQGRWREAKQMHRKMQSVPSQVLSDPDFRRLRYVRYADDFLLSFIGPRSEAEEIKRLIREFLRDTLKLELSQAKTLITHARTEAANFLGYEVKIFHDDHKHTKDRRSINGLIGLRVPKRVIKEKCASYMKNDKPRHKAERRNDSAYSIVSQYQAEYRGVVNYYQMAYNLSQLNRLKWVMETSLLKTLAAKFRSSVSKVFRRYKTQVGTKYGKMRAIQVKVGRESKPPLVATWGGIALRWKKGATLDDNPKQVRSGRTELLQRMLADICELCGSEDGCEVHHIRHMKDLERPGRRPKPEWVKRMAARRRKTLVVCKACHRGIHGGGTRKKEAKRNVDTGEPDELKGSRPVRRGADGEVPI